MGLQMNPNYPTAGIKIGENSFVLCARLLWGNGRSS
jgi:hypothetical protein